MPRRSLALRLHAWGKPAKRDAELLGTTLLMKPLCSAACAPEMADSWDAVPGLAPVWERLCG